MTTVAPVQAFLTNQQLRQEFDVAISRRIARDSAGRIYLLTISPGPGGRTTVHLQVGPPTARNIADFTEFALPVRVAGFEDNVRSAGLVVDREDRLHVVWTNEDGQTGYTMQLPSSVGETHANDWVNPVTGKHGALILAPELSNIGDITLGPKGEPWLTWSVSQVSHNTVQYLGTWIEGRWQARPTAEGYGLAPASLMVDRRGGYHLSWHDIYETSWSLAGGFDTPDRASTPKPLPGSGFRPVMAVTGDSILVVRENNHYQLQFSPPAKVPVTFTALVNSADDHRFEWDTLHHTQMVVDGYGIPWVFFVDSARCTVFCSRWLGTRWGPAETAGSLVRNSARMEDNHLTIDRIAVEAHVTPEGNDICLLLENTSDVPTTSFRRIVVQAPAAEPGRKLLFLDLGEIASLDGAVLNLNSPQKQGMIIQPGEPGSFDSDRTGPFVRVLKGNGRYRMWYSGYKLPAKSAGWWEGYRVGYAESGDGRRFEPVNVGLTSFNEKPDSNVIPGMPYVPPGILYDAQEPRPERRYKVLKFPSAGAQDDEARAGRMDPWSARIDGQLLVSSDGIHWTAEPAAMDFPAGRPEELIPQSFFYDAGERDPARRYKAYGYSSLNAHRRVGSLAYSADARHWTAWPGNPVLDPFAGGEIPVRGGIVAQIHDTIVWQYGGYYLAIYQYMHDKEFIDLRLAVSRDGESFTFVQPGRVFLAPGKDEEWDAKELNPSVPLVDSGEIKIYYGAAQNIAEHRKGGIGVATLRLDGFTDLQIKPGRTAANFTTVPVRAGRAETLFLNADGGDGRIKVELVEAATGRVLNDYGAADCIPIVGDAAAQPVRWKNQTGLKGIRGDFLVRVYLEGTVAGPKVYSIGFQ